MAHKCRIIVLRTNLGTIRARAVLDCGRRKCDSCSLKFDCFTSNDIIVEDSFCEANFWWNNKFDRFEWKSGQMRHLRLTVTVHPEAWALPFGILWDYPSSYSSQPTAIGFIILCFHFIWVNKTLKRV